MVEQSEYPISDALLRLYLSVEDMRPHLVGDVAAHAAQWRFLEAALHKLEDRELLRENPLSPQWLPPGSEGEFDDHLYGEDWRDCPCGPSVSGIGSLIAHRAPQAVPFYDDPSAHTTGGAWATCRCDPDAPTEVGAPIVHRPLGAAAWLRALPSISVA